MILMLDVFNEITFIIINVNLFLNNNDIQFERNESKRDVINLINIKNNNYFIII